MLGTLCMLPLDSFSYTSPLRIFVYWEKLGREFWIYPCDISSLTCMSPSGHKTVGSCIEVRLGQTHWSHVTVVFDWRLQLHQSYVIVVIIIGVIFWMFNDSVNGDILLIALQSVEIMFTCRYSKRTKCTYHRLAFI